MRLITSALALLVAASAVTATPISASDDGKPLVRLPLVRKPRTVDMLTARRQRSSPHLNKRDPFQTSLYNDEGSQYLVEVGIGSPAQNFTVTLDTGR